jgi:hypothetical protein
MADEGRVAAILTVRTRPRPRANLAKREPRAVPLNKDEFKYYQELAVCPRNI